MAVLPREILIRGAAVMAEDDETLDIGGALAISVGVMFFSRAGLYQIVGSDPADLLASIELTFRDAVNHVQTQAAVLQGTLPVPLPQGVFRLLKGAKSASTAGDVAVEHQTPSFFDFAVSGGVDSAVLPLTAPAASGALTGQVLRVTEGAEAGGIAQVIDYDGVSKTVLLSRAFTGALDSTSKVRIAPGFVFHKDPFEELIVTRVLVSLRPTQAAGSRKFYGKMFFYNASADPLAFPRIVDTVNPGGRFKYAIDADGVDGTSTNGPENNRQVAPAGVTFVNGLTFSDDIEIPAGSALGVWVEETVEQDAPFGDDIYQFIIAGD